MDAFERQLANKNAQLVALYDEHLHDIVWVQNQLNARRIPANMAPSGLDYIDDSAYIFRMLRKHNFVLERTLENVNIALKQDGASEDVSGKPLVEIRQSSGSHLVCMASLSCLSSPIDDLKARILDACRTIRVALSMRSPHQGLQFVLVLDVRDAAPSPSTVYDLVPWYIREIHPRFPGMCAAVLVRGYSWAHASAWTIFRRILPASAVTRVQFPTNAELEFFLQKSSRKEQISISTDNVPLGRSEPVSPLAARSHVNPTYGYPPHSRRRKRDLVRTLFHLWALRWRKSVAAWSTFALIWALLVMSRRWRIS